MNKKAFTLIELLAVIMLLALLLILFATKGFGAFNNAKKSIVSLDEKSALEAAKILGADIEYCDPNDEEFTNRIRSIGYNSCNEIQNALKSGTFTITLDNLRSLGYISGSNVEGYKSNSMVKIFYVNGKISAKMNSSIVKTATTDCTDYNIVDYFYEFLNDMYNDVEFDPNIDCDDVKESDINNNASKYFFGYSEDYFLCDAKSNDGLTVYTNLNLLKKYNYNNLSSCNMEIDFETSDRTDIKSQYINNNEGIYNVLDINNDTLFDNEDLQLFLKCYNSSSEECLSRTILDVSLIDSRALSLHLYYIGFPPIKIVFKVGDANKIVYDVSINRTHIINN